MIITLWLILVNVYSAVDAPSGRGFSNIEIWIMGVSFPIQLALIEYGFILYLKKRGFDDQNQKFSADHSKGTHSKLSKFGHQKMVPVKPDFNEKIKMLDFVTMIASLTCFLIFALLYWFIFQKM